MECLLKRSLARLNVEIFSDKEEMPVDEGKVLINSNALRALADLADGDARSALNSLQLAVQTKRASLDNLVIYKPVKAPVTTPVGNKSVEITCTPVDNSIISTEDIKICLQKTHLLYDRTDEHYHCISALHKSMRGSDANASLYWLARMLCAGEDPLYVARRVINFASEDVGKLWRST